MSNIRHVELQMNMRVSRAALQDLVHDYGMDLDTMTDAEIAAFARFYAESHTSFDEYWQPVVINRH